MCILATMPTTKWTSLVMASWSGLAESHRLLASARPLATVAFVAAVLAISTASALAQSSTKREPRNDKEDVAKIGDRGVGKAFNLYTLKAEQRMGKEAAELVEKRESILEDPVTAEFVNRIAQNLGRNSDAKVPIVAKVIDSKEVNAMALPGGFIFVNAGLIEFAADESELAGVLAHEIAHVAARHGTRNLSRAQTASLVTGVLAELGGKKANAVYAGASLVLPLTFLKFSRSFEKQADFLGVQYLHASGYDPLGMVQFFERLSAAGRSKGNVISNLFRSHPLSRKRVRLVQKAIDELLPARPSYNVTGSEFDQIKARLRSRGEQSRH